MLGSCLQLRCFLTTLLDSVQPPFSDAFVAAMAEVSYNDTQNKSQEEEEKAKHSQGSGLATTVPENPSSVSVASDVRILFFAVPCFQYFLFVRFYFDFFYLCPLRYFVVHPSLPRCRLLTLKVPLTHFSLVFSLILNCASLYNL